MPYIKPAIAKLQSGFLNKFGAHPEFAREICHEISGVPVEKLLKEYGSPLFVFCQATMEKKVAHLKSAFKALPNMQLCWSYKTNYLNGINQVFHDKGLIAEVVSEMEYDKARSLGIEGKHIIFNGPNKSLQALEKAVTEGAMIHIDHFDEIDDLDSVSRKLKKNINVAIRLSLDANIYPMWTRFGFNLESGQAMDAARRIMNCKYIKLVGLHCHIGTFILSPEAYGVQTEKMLQFRESLLDTLNIEIKYLDLGGGFASHNQLKSLTQPIENICPSADEYAEPIIQAIKKYHAEKLKIYLETGRYLIDEAGYLLTSVKARKRLVDGTKAYILDAGVNLLYTSYWYDFKIKLGCKVPGAVEPSLLYGPLCMNIDVINQLTPLPPLDRNTPLVIHPVGAYNVTQWMQFIEYRPNVVLINNKAVSLIRSKEDLDHLQSPERGLK